MSWFTTIMEEFPFIPPQSIAGRTLGNVLERWLARRMDVSYQANVVNEPMQVLPSGGNIEDGRREEIKPALTIGGCIRVLNRHYSVKLEKVPCSFLLQEYTVVWLEGREANPQALIPTRVVDKIVSHRGRFYRVNLEVSTDCEYLIRMNIARL